MRKLLSVGARPRPSAGDDGGWGDFGADDFEREGAGSYGCCGACSCGGHD